MIGYLLLDESKILPLVIKAKSKNGGGKKAKNEIVEMVFPYFKELASSVKHRFNGKFSLSDSDDLVQEASIILVERIIPKYDIKKGVPFLGYMCCSIYKDMFKQIDRETERTIQYVPLHNIADSDGANGDEDWAFRRFVSRGLKAPQYLADYGCEMLEIRQLINEVKKVNPVGAEIISAEIELEHPLPLKEFMGTRIMSMPTLSRRKKLAVKQLRRQLNYL